MSLRARILAGERALVRSKYGEGEPFEVEYRRHVYPPHLAIFRIGERCAISRPVLHRADFDAWIENVEEIPRRERQYKRILASEVARGRPRDEAERIAAATVNRRRRALAESGEGPALVGEGGSRRQWYPGKERAGRRGR